jgi:hypothetical protein
VTLRLAVARADRGDRSCRLRVGRLDLAVGGDASRLLWPSRWHHNIVVLSPKWTPTPATEEEEEPVRLMPDARLRLPSTLCAALDLPHQQVLVACDGREVWLANATWLAPRLP